MNEEKLWSPQMRKWHRDSERHGKRIYLAREAGGRPAGDRVTDTLDDRVVDGWTGNVNFLDTFARYVD